MSAIENLKKVFKDKTLTIIIKKGRGSNDDPESMKDAFTEAFGQFKELLMAIGPDERRAFLEGCGETIDQEVDFESEEAIGDLFSGCDEETITALMSFMIESGAINFEDEKDDDP